LSLDREANKDKVFLQGWAIVENTTDEDWNNVRLGLISGRPISFQMDLYQPLYLHRPEVQLELFSSLRPPLPELGYTIISGDNPMTKDEKKILDAIRSESARGAG